MRNLCESSNTYIPQDFKLVPIMCPVLALRTLYYDCTLK